jgi:pyruvate dehydrogenase E2 component (dihydrolipoamide acetyltransferase)
MSIEFKLPSIGEGVETADVAEIHVKPGDTIEANQVVAELETEKAVVELPCPHAGTVKELRVKSGDTIKVGDVVLTIDAAEDGAATASHAAQPVTPSPSAIETTAKPQTSAGVKPPAEPPADDPPAPPAAAANPGAAQRIEFQLPALGEGIESAEVAEIHVQGGDSIEAEQVVMDLETEKAVIELPCPFAGTIEALHVARGATVKIGQILFTLATTGAAPARPAAPVPAIPQPAPVPVPAPKPPAASVAARRSRQRRIERSATAPRGQTPPPQTALLSRRRRRRAARQLGVDLRDVKASGPRPHHT